MGQHSHEHNGHCHAADPPYYDGIDESKIELKEITKDYICYTTDTGSHGEVKSCTRIPEEDGTAQELLDWVEDVGIDYAALAACTATGPLALKCGAIVIGEVAVKELLEIFCVPGFCDESDQPPVVGTNQRPPPTAKTTQPPPTTAEAPEYDDDPSALDNSDYTYDGGKYARRMCRQYSNEYFCNLVAANEPADGQ
ncbi:MAG: hypothetical protein OXH86_17620 [Acidimicrobiaceae bacterium]|nr:hypothetical protein [Acidimicrobiaceae bacterium]